MHIILILIVCVQLQKVNTLVANYLWETWKTVHEKVYDNSTEESFRKFKWEESIREIIAHNIRHDLGLETYTIGLNQFADLDWHEIQSMFPPILTNHRSDRSSDQSYESLLNVTQTEEIQDWRDKGCVTKVKNENKCMASYGFSAIGCLECQYKMRTGSLKSFSTQELVDCGSDYGLFGCLGGSVEKALHYMKDNGINFETKYKFQGRSQDCKRNATDKVVRPTIAERLKVNDERTFTRYITKIGPMSVSIHADQKFYKYKSGVYVSRKCKKTVSNRALLVVGYGTKKSKDYYILKNSWGTKWGEDGYIRMGRNLDNMCGIISNVYYALYE